MAKKPQQQTETERIKHRTSEFRDIKLEKVFVGCLLKHHHVFRKIINTFKSEALSSDKVKWVYDKAVEFYNHEGAMLDSDTYELMLEVDHKKKAPYLAIWKSILKASKKKGENVAFAAKMKLQRLFQARTIEVGMKDVLISLGKAAKGDYKNVDDAAKYLNSTNERVIVKDIPVVITDPFEKWDDYMVHYNRAKKNPDEMMGVSTGIGVIDKNMGGLRKAEFGLVTASTGVGKSIILMDMAAHAWKTAGDVAYITIEMPEDQLRQRLYCRLSGIKYEKFRGFKLDKEDIKKLNKTMRLARESDNKFHIIDFPESCTVDMIKMEVENLLRKSEIKMIFIDYLNIVRTGTAGVIDLGWIGQTEAAINVKQKICRYFNIPTWSANQIAGASDGKERLTRADFAFGKNLLDNVDVCFYIAENLETESTGMLAGRFLKGREFSIKGEFHIRDHRDYMRFSNPGDDNKKVKTEKKVLKKKRKVKV